MKKALPAIFLLFSMVPIVKSQDRARLPDEFQQAGAESNIPPAILKGIAFAETRWSHIEYPEGETVNWQGVPHQYGIMALRDDDWFGHSLTEGARLIGKKPAEVKADRFQNIRAAAAYLRMLYDQQPKPDGIAASQIESWQNAVAKYCGIPQKELALEHTLAIYSCLKNGYHDYGIAIDAMPVDVTFLKEQMKLAVKESASRSAQNAAKPNGKPDYPLAHWVSAADGHWYTTGVSRSFVVIHDMEGYYLSCISYFQNASTQASAHYCINGLQDSPSDAPAGDITQMVEEQYWAWHVVCWNKYMLGIEHEGFVSNPAWWTDKMYVESAKLVKFMCDRWSIPKDRNHIVGHGEWQNSNWVSWLKTNFPAIDATCNNHTDPGVNWDWTFFMQLVTENKTAPKVTSTPPTGKVQVYDGISIGFDQRMDRAAVQSAFSIAPAMTGGFQWSADGKTVTFKPSTIFSYKTTYAVKLDTTAVNYLSVKIDQNGDGKADSYSFSFTTVDNDTIAPSVTDVYPPKNGTDISRTADFIIAMSEPLDSVSVASGIELRDQSAVVVPMTAPASVITGNTSRISLKPIASLSPGKSYTLTVKNSIKDLAGNPLVSTVVVPFTTEPVTTFFGTVVEGVDAVGSWTQPSFSGSTVNVEATFAVVSSPKIGGSGAGKLTYRFTQASGGVMREYNSAKPTVEGGAYFGVWVYGDNSKHLLEYWIYNPSATMKFVDTVNWTGWKLKAIPVSSVPGTGRTLAGIVLKQNQGGTSSGAIYIDELTVGNIISGVTPLLPVIPTEYALEQNYPNPFNPSTTIRFALPEQSTVRLDVINALGQIVETIADREMEPGFHEVVWNAKVASGVYFCKLTAAPHSGASDRCVLTAKMILMR
ncbi:MAG: Ig-like domain-containing protein [Ignavibacteriales bacterium]|nr:Ig-like domain-containing protein [Ignavibacteriales bacterium]